MKKTLLILSLITGTIFGANAQCTPDFSQTEIGATPSNLPTACENSEYNETITVTIKKGVVIFGQTVNVDSAYITNVTNLHAGFSYSCHNSNCFIELTSSDIAHGCVAIAGTPTETGTNTMKVEYIAYLNGNEFPGSYNVDVTVKAEADAECNVQNIFSVNDVNNKLGVYPNPSNGQELSFNSTLHNVSIVDQLGNVVYTAPSANKIHLNSAVKGIYFLKADEGIEKIIIK